MQSELHAHREKGEMKKCNFIQPRCILYILHFHHSQHLQYYRFISPARSGWWIMWIYRFQAAIVAQKEESEFATCWHRTFFISCMLKCTQQNRNGKLRLCSMSSVVYIRWNWKLMTEKGKKKRNRKSFIILEINGIIELCRQKKWKLIESHER